MREPVVAVVGATGAVGREMVSVLQDRAFPLGSLRLYASAKSAGAEIEFNDDTIDVEELTEHSFEGVDIALFSAGGDVSKRFAPRAVDAGAVVIDNSSAWRMEPGVPLVVPEVNADVLRTALREKPKAKGLIVANPNCSTIQLAVVLKPIHDRFGLKRVVVSTYQSVSGAGQKAMDELWEQTLGIFNQQEVAPQKFPHRIAFNCLPQVDVFLENGYTKEEMKVVNESRKILGLPQLRITSTAVRVPVFISHAESVNIETDRPMSLQDLRTTLVSSPGIVVQDNVEAREYPLQSSVAGTDATFVGRIRLDDSVEHGCNLWIVADNLRKGAALNAVQIAEIVQTEWGRA